MKIFAKRKRKAAPDATVTESKERDTFASDPIVMELLRKDPKEWNAKERRMIKRYEERTGESLASNPMAQDNTDECVNEGNEIPEEEIAKQGGNKSNDDTDSNDSDSSSKDDSEGPSEKLEDVALPAATTQQDDANAEDATSGKPSDEPTTFDDKIEDDVGGEVDPENEVYKLLEKLNSKMKRTLSRKLERQGATVLREVEDEAKKILGENSGKEESKKRDSGALEAKPGPEEKQSNKKRKKEVDLSNLSPEERLRREDQRRKQKEAVERRAREEDEKSGHKHALNSERRRANRRKPKWKNGTSPSSGSSGVKPVKNEHNHSGYHHRKQAV